MPAGKPFYIEPFQTQLMGAIELIPLSQRKEVGRELRKQLTIGTGLHALRALLSAIYAPRFVDMVERWPKKKIRRRS